VAQLNCCGNGACRENDERCHGGYRVYRFEHALIREVLDEQQAAIAR
jgi:hypothetical protein